MNKTNLLTSISPFQIVDLPDENRFGVLQIINPTKWAAATYPLGEYKFREITVRLSADVKRVGAPGLLRWQINNKDDYPSIGDEILNAKADTWYSMRGEWTGVARDFEPEIHLSTWQNNSDITTYYIDNFTIEIIPGELTNVYKKASAELDALIGKMGRTMETLDHYISTKRQENADIGELIQLMLHYLNEIGDADLSAELDLHGFCACRMSRLSNVTKEMYGDEVWGKIFGGLEIPTETWTDWTQDERKDFALSIQKKFLSAASLDDYKRALEGVSSTWYPLETSQKEVTLSDVDAFIKERNENYVKDLTANHGSDDAIMAEFNTEKWKTRREGSKIIIVNRPFQLNKYVSQTDDKMKRYYACGCPWARTSILKGETVSTAHCHCSLGYTKHDFDNLFGKRLNGRVLKSALNECDLQCVFEIDIPDSIM